MSNTRRPSQEIRLRIVLAGRWTVGELAEFLRRLDELYAFAHVLNQALNMEKPPERMEYWLQQSRLYSLPVLPDFSEQVKAEIREIHSYFPPGGELRLVRIRLGSPNFVDLLGLAKLSENIAHGFHYLITFGWRKDRAVNEIQVRKQLLDLASDHVKLMNKLGYSKAKIEETIGQQYGLYQKIRPFVDDGKVIDVKVETGRKSLPRARALKTKDRSKGKRPRQKP